MNLKQIEAQAGKLQFEAVLSVQYDSLSGDVSGIGFHPVPGGRFPSYAEMLGIIKMMENTVAQQYPAIRAQFNKETNQKIIS